MLGTVKRNESTLKSLCIHQTKWINDMSCISFVCALFNQFAICDTRQYTKSFVHSLQFTIHQNTVHEYEAQRLKQRYWCSVLHVRSLFSRFGATFSRTIKRVTKRYSTIHNGCVQQTRENQQRTSTSAPTHTENDNIHRFNYSINLQRCLS